MTLLAFRGLEKTSPAFRGELERMADRLGMDANAIAGVISLESGFQPAIQNKQSGATGLIQFMPTTAVGLGTTTNDLKRMSDVDQLPYVEKYFSPFVGKIQTRGDYYLAVFMPAFIGAPDTRVIAEKGSKVYDQNAVLDGDKDGRLTVGDVRQKLLDRIRQAEGLPPLSPVIVPRPSSLVPWAFVIGLGGAIFLGTLRSPSRRHA